MLVITLAAGSVTFAFAADVWQTESKPALSPGQLTDWDDFQVGSSCVVPVDGGWRMYFEGARLDEDGLSQGIGVAMSDDGRAWRKHEDNPVVAADTSQPSQSQSKRLSLPVVCRLRDNLWLMICTETDQNMGTSRLCVLNSIDGIDWERDLDSGEKLAKAASGLELFSPSLCSNPLRNERVQLWCLKRPDGGNYYDVTKLSLVMLQTNDGKSWKQLIERPVTELEPAGLLRHIRFVIDGESWVASYLFGEPESGEPKRIRFRKSADAIRWKPAGPADYALPTGIDGAGRATISRPSLLIRDDETRVFYTEQNENGSRQIAVAIFLKARPRPAP
jgi:hypothetical protein